MSSSIFFWRKPKPLPAPVAVAGAHRATTIDVEDGIELGDGQRWNPAKLANAHIVAIGASGSGKTQTLKGIAYALGRAYSQARIIIIDFHGDQDLDGEVCYALHRASPHGINLLAVNLDPEGGGVSLQAIQVVHSFKRSLLLGVNQEGTLLAMIKRAYTARGICDEQQETWTLEAPTLADVREQLESDESKEARKLELKLSTTFEYGIFSRPQPSLTHHVTRIDLSKLPPSLQAIAAESLAMQLMNEHRLLGEMEGKEPRTFLFIDEAKEMSTEANSATNRIIADGRKYGLALALASQSERHLSRDVIGNSSTKIVLPVDQTEVRAVANKFRFAENHVASLKPLTALCRFGTDAARVAILPYYKRRSHDANAA